MPFRPWNPEWEKPDPLRGRRGWAAHHFASFGVGVAMVVLVVGLLMPAIVRAQLRQAKIQRERKQLQMDMIDRLNAVLNPR